MDAKNEPGSDRFFLRGIIEQFQDKDAVILLQDGQKIRWPIKDLPEDATIGSIVRLILSTAASDQTEREQIAKTILNQILHNGPSSSHV